MKAKEIMWLADAINTFRAEAPKPKREPKEKPRGIEALIEFQREIDEYEKWRADRAKIEKKEDKKEEKKGWAAMSFLQKLVVLTAGAPFVMLTWFLSVAMIIKMAKGL